MLSLNSEIYSDVKGISVRYCVPVSSIVNRLLYLFMINDDYLFNKVFMPSTIEGLSTYSTKGV